MDKLFNEVSSLIEGNPLPVDNVDISNEKAEQFEPLTKKNTGYIVCGVLFNDDVQILMMQEAKYSCYGTWYLPAGRVEPNENFYDAVKREVLEEAGIEFEPTTLVNVEMGCGTWYRYTFTGKVTGGKLKTLEEKDKESLQAEWFDWDVIKKREIKLRSKDIIPLIEVARKYLDTSVAHHPMHMPSIHPYRRFIHRVLLVHRGQHNRAMHILIHRNGESANIPTAYISPFDFSVQISVLSILKESVGKASISVSMHGLLSLEHGGGVKVKVKDQHDGYCMSTLWQIQDQNETPPAIESDKYEWLPITDELVGDLDGRMTKGMCIPFIDLNSTRS